MYEKEGKMQIEKRATTRIDMNLIKFTELFEIFKTLKFFRFDDVIHVLWQRYFAVYTITYNVTHCRTCDG
jgi:hypothetical protein